MHRAPPIATLPLFFGIALVASQALAADFTGRVVGVSDGDTSPDAVLLADSAKDNALLRSERAGTRNGRIYQINFTASDGFETCQGAVQVSVPHSWKATAVKATAVDDGQTVDSTQPAFFPDTPKVRWRRSRG